MSKNFEQIAAEKIISSIAPLDVWLGWWLTDRFNRHPGIIYTATMYAHRVTLVNDEWSFIYASYLAWRKRRG